MEMKIEIKDYKSIGYFQLSDVLPFVINSGVVNDARRFGGIKKGDSRFKEMFERDYLGYSVKMYSDRYTLFKEKGVECVSCGLKGQFFSLEQSWNTDNADRFHFNLYGLDADNNPILITKDHIKPKSKGGRNCQSNYQVMCTHCNCLKGSN